MTMPFYLARRFLAVFGKTLFVIACLVVLIEGVENLRRYGEATEGMGAIITLTLLKLPGVFQQVMPLVILIAALSLFVSLSRNAELVSARAAGISAFRIALIPALASFALGIVAVALLDPLVAATTRAHDSYEASVLDKPQSVFSAGQDGVWLRQVTEEGPAVIEAARASADGAVLYSVSFSLFNPDGTLRGRVLASNARLEAGEWVLTGMNQWEIRERDGIPIPFDTTKESQGRIPTNLTRAQILDSFAPPQTISVWDMPRFVAGLEQSGFTAIRHRQHFQTTLTIPLVLGTMALIGGALTMRHARFGHVGVMVMVTVLFGFALYFLRSLASSLGAAGSIPVVFAAWAPPIAMAMLAVGVLLQGEDG